MNALFLILNDIYLLEEVHEIMYQCEVGATTIDSRGMGKVLVDNEVDITMFTSMRRLLEGDKPYNKLIISVIRDDEKLERVIKKLQDKITNIYEKGIGFMFVVPVSHVYGYNVSDDKEKIQK